MAKNYPNFDYKKTYEFRITPFSFGDLGEKDLLDLFMDGRVASKFLEKHIPIWFPTLKFVDETGYDFVDSSAKAKKMKREHIDQKAFTKRGANYAPSGMIGVGRKVNLQEFQAHAAHTNYCFTDITKFPQVRICFWTGADLMEKFGSNKIGVSMKDKLFP